MPKISDEKIEEMFQVYKEKQSVHYVNQKCQVNRNTITKYRDKYNWDERIEKIKEKTMIRSDDREVNRRVEYLKYTHSLLMKIIDKITPEEIESMKTYDKINSYEKILKLAYALMGENLDSGNNVTVVINDKIIDVEKEK